MRGSRPLDQTELRALLDAVEGPYAHRDRSLIMLGVHLGLRGANLTRLTVDDVWHRDAPRRFLRLSARQMKGRRGHAVPINRTAQQVIINLMAWKRSRNEPTGSRDPLFRSRKGGPITTRRALQIVQESAHRAGLDPGVGVHSLRKTAATTLMERGVPLRVVQEVLGHAKLETTAAYLGVGTGALRDALRTLEG